MLEESRAVVCLDCSLLRDVSEPVCPRCASHSAFLWVKWLSESAGKKVKP